MNARNVPLVSVTVAAVRTIGADTSASAREAFSTSRSKTLVSVRKHLLVGTTTLTNSHSSSFFLSNFDSYNLISHPATYIMCSIFFRMLWAERRGSKFAWFITFVVLAAVAGVALAGYIFYKYRLRVRLWLFWVCFTLRVGKICKFLSSFCSHTWTRRSWLLCRSTCRSTVSIITESRRWSQSHYD